MRVSSLGVARPAYYDRNATSVLNSYSATVSPHGYTTRFTYTVASGRKMLVEALTIRQQRATAATVVGAYYAQIATFVGSDAILNSYVYSLDNTITSPLFNQASTQVTIYAGEQVQCSTQDSSTGGTVTYLASFKATLFDA